MTEAIPDLIVLEDSKEGKMTKKINILLTKEDINKVVKDYKFRPGIHSLEQIPFIKVEIAKEAQKKMWIRLIELGLLKEGHDCTNWERTGGSPGHSPVCRWCRVKKELGIKDDQTNNSR